jgi:hypothetical protein
MLSRLTELGSSAGAAYLIAILGNVFLASMQILIKQASAVLSAFQILYIRSVFLIAISLHSLQRMGVPPYIKPSRRTAALPQSSG